MSNVGHNPNLVQRPTFPLSTKGNTIVDAKGRKVAVVFTGTASATASYLVGILNEYAEKNVLP